MMEEAERIALDVSGRPAGDLRISTSLDFGRDRLAPLVPESRPRYPDIRLQVLLAQRRIDMVAEGIDVALRGGVLSDAGYVARKLASSDIVFVASPTYLDARGRPERVEDLGEHDLVTLGVEARPMDWRVPGPDGPVVSDDVGAGRLEHVLPSCRIQGGGLYAVYPSRHHLTPKVRVFVDYLAEKLRDGLGPPRRLFSSPVTRESPLDMR